MTTEPVHDVTRDTLDILQSTPSGLEKRQVHWGRFWATAVFYIVVGFFLLNLVGLVGSVVIDSVGKEWFNTWFPRGLITMQWYAYETADHDVILLLENTLLLALFTTFLALLIGFPAAYVLARKQFRFKSVLLGLYLLPMLVPPLAYGIPLATLLLRLLGGSLVSVILINVVPTLPFVVLVLVPFIEQIDMRLESVSRMLGANRLQTFVRIVLPLVVPGLLTASVLTVVRTIAMFDLTYLVADPTATTLVVTLYGDAFASGMRPAQAIDAMAVIYMLTTMSLLGVALIFVKPTQFVVRLKGQ